MSVLCVSNQKGGTGKTTTAVSLGAILAQRGQRVLLIDLDPQANATSALGVGKDLSPSARDVLLDDAPISSAMRETGIAGLWLVPSSTEMAGVEVELVPAMAREFRLRQALESAGTFDIVIVDCPPSLGLLTVNALSAAEWVLVPVQTEYLALEGLAQLVRTIGAVRSRLNPRLKVLAIVLTMADARNRLSLQVCEEVERHFPELVAQTRIPRTVRLAEAPSHGLPITVYDASSRASDSYRALADELQVRLRADARAHAVTAS